MAESQKKSKGGRKPKYDYKSEEFLSLVESYAKKGFTDKEIACAIGIDPETFSRKKNELNQLNQMLSRARAAISPNLFCLLLDDSLTHVRCRYKFDAKFC